MVPTLESESDTTSERPLLRTGGQPTEEQLRDWASHGLELVIDLRGPDEARGIDEAGILDELDVSYVPLPIAQRADLDWDHATALDAYLTHAEGAVLVHCRSGNRVGALMALRFGLNPEETTEAALAYGRDHGLTSRELEATVSELLNGR